MIVKKCLKKRLHTRERSFLFFFIFFSFKGRHHSGNSLNATKDEIVKDAELTKSFTSILFIFFSKPRKITTDELLETLDASSMDKLRKSQRTRSHTLVVKTYKIIQTRSLSCVRFQFLFQLSGLYFCSSVKEKRYTQLDFEPAVVMVTAPKNDNHWRKEAQLCISSLSLRLRAQSTFFFFQKYSNLSDETLVQKMKLFSLKQL